MAEPHVTVDPSRPRAGLQCHYECAALTAQEECFNADPSSSLRQYVARATHCNRPSTDCVGQL